MTQSQHKPAVERANDAGYGGTLHTWLRSADLDLRRWFFRIWAFMCIIYCTFAFISGAHVRGVLTFILGCISVLALWFLSPHRGLSDESVERRLLCIIALVPVLMRGNLVWESEGPQYHSWVETLEMTPSVVGAFVRHSRLLSLYSVAFPASFVILRFRRFSIVPICILVADAIVSMFMQLVLIYESPIEDDRPRDLMAVSVFVSQFIPVVMSIIVTRELNYRDHCLMKMMVTENTEGESSTKELDSPVEKLANTEVPEELQHTPDSPLTPQTTDSVAGAAEGGVCQDYPCEQENQSHNAQHKQSQFYRNSKKASTMDLDVPSVEEKLATPTRLQLLVKSHVFNIVVSLVLVLNMVCMALFADMGKAYSDASGASNPFFVADVCFAIIYSAEISLRIAAYRCGFFKDAWNDFELFLVLAGNVDVFMSNGLNPVLMRSLRMLRLARMVKLGRNFRELRVIMESVLRSLRVVAWSVGLLLMINFISAIFCTQAIGRSEWIQTIDLDERDRLTELFDSVPRTMFTLFQVQTLEGWSDNIVRPVLKHEPRFVLFFVPYVLFMTLCVLNVVAAVIVDSTAGSNAHENEIEKMAQMREARDALVVQLKALLEHVLQGRTTISRHEWLSTLDHSTAIETLTSVGLTGDQTLDMFDALDPNRTGNIDADNFIICLSRGVEGVKHIDVTCLRASMWQAQKNMNNDLLRDLTKLLSERNSPKEDSATTRLTESMDHVSELNTDKCERLHL